MIIKGSNKMNKTIVIDKQAGTFLVFEKMSDNTLKISLTELGKTEICDIAAKSSLTDEHEFLALAEDLFANGWDIVMPEEIGALTDCLIITDDISRDDTTDEITDIGTIYSYIESYQIKGYLDDLQEFGEVIWMGTT